MSTRLLTSRDIRRLLNELDIRPTKSRGQNFVHDPNTIRRIVHLSGVSSTDDVVEIGPGLGSLTLGLLDHAHSVQAIEIDSILAGRLAHTVNEHSPQFCQKLSVIHADALSVTPDQLLITPTTLVANLPYNVAVPILLTFLEKFPSITRGLVLVQAEVADRLVAQPGTASYGVPSAKLAWYATSRRVGNVPAGVFWPTPRVESGLVEFIRCEPPQPKGISVSAAEVFPIINAAFAQRRKILRTALAAWAGSTDKAEGILREATIDPGLRGEMLDIAAYARIAYHARGGMS